MFDPAQYLQNLFYAAGGFAFLLGLPVLASKIKGGIPLMLMGVAAFAFYAYDQGYIWF